MASKKKNSQKSGLKPKLKSGQKSVVQAARTSGKTSTQKAGIKSKAINSKTSAKILMNAPKHGKKLVYSFGDGKAEGTELMRDLLGGKGANLHGMTSLGLPVPPGFTVTTEVCTHFYKHNQAYPSHLKGEVMAAMMKMEATLKRGFGDPKNPLLVSVRSGARASMPGMMDTILNLGLNDETVKGLVADSNNPRFGFDSYRRFITMYSDVVLGIHSSQFESELENLKHERGFHLDTELPAEDLEKLVAEFKRIVKNNGHKFPTDVYEQLWGAMGAVFGSWMSPRAITYRRLNDIPESWGTAVNVQAMVFGNLGDDCATGVAFTRDPSSGDKKFFGEYLINAQGEDVVSGIRTPSPVNESSRMELEKSASETLEHRMPKAYKELVKLYKILEKHYRDMQDIEFTIERNKLFMLQTRNGKRTAKAALKIAIDLVKEKLISKEEAIMRVNPEQLDQLLHPCVDPNADKKVIARGLPASPGAASGQVVFDPDTAEHWVKDLGRKVILIRQETSPEDIHGMSVAEGILTARGGMTSHAAVVARGMGKCCISGCSEIRIDQETKIFSVGTSVDKQKVYKEGDYITLDGSTGEVIEGQVATITPTLNDDFRTFMSWVDQYRVLGVRTNADTPQDAKHARNFGAEGIGLCRTEHMFFDPERIDVVREMILADSEQGRIQALNKILPMQRSDFESIFREMKGYPVTIRLLDPPLHEFIPQKREELMELAEKMHVSFDQLRRKAESLHEFNPMLGHRGCRLGISFPEIYRTQVRAIVEAALNCCNEGMKIEPEIMIPLVGDYRELKYVREYCEEEISKVLNESQVCVLETGLKVGGSRAVSSKPALDNPCVRQFKYKIGTMIELPRAALTAGKIAQYADFFSFGTNDLTQTTYGLSRDDSGLFLNDYLNRKIFERDPFASLDAEGVGRLMEIASIEGRLTRKDLKVGICGEHGGDPASIEICSRLGLNYVSCSPFRVPIAKLAAARSAIKARKLVG